jgi:uncharacterized protein (DUF2225 family)
LINISTIKNISRVKKYAQGAVISGDGTGNILFVILKGEVGVYVNYRLPGSELIQALGSGDLFADPGLLQDKKASYTTVALGDTLVIPIERKGAFDFLQDEPALSYELLKEFSLRLEQTTASYKDLIVRHDELQRPLDKKQLGKKPAQPEREAGPAAWAGPAADPNPAPVTEDPAQKARRKLFPAEHGTYELPLHKTDPTNLMNKSYTCPVCRSYFVSFVPKPSKLVLTSTDADLRHHYRGIEPLYFEVITCPYCMYSALPDVFDIPDKARQDILKELEQFRDAVHVSAGVDRDAESVFTGYYLALYSAPVSFIKYQLVAAKLLYKLSRVYADAGDVVMENATARKALDNYLYAYTRIGVPPAQEQQVCTLIGELYLKQNGPKDALAFFNRARSLSGGNPTLKSHAEQRASELRNLVGKLK